MKRESFWVGSFFFLTACGSSGTISGGHCTITEGNLDASVTIPSGDICNFEGIDFGGNVVIASGAMFTANNITVDGDLGGQGADGVIIEHSQIYGNVQMKAGGDVKLVSNKVTGDIILQANRGTQTLSQNEVTGGVQLSSNVGTTAIDGNIITGDLACTDNDPVPSGDKNVVTGTKQDQCSTL